MKRFLLIGVFFLTACGVSQGAAQPVAEPAVTAAVPPDASVVCEPEAFIKQIEPLAREWTDTVTLANSTPRMQLAAQIAKLQDIQRRTDALEAPTCAASAQQYLSREMDFTNRAFVGFLSQKSSAPNKNRPHLIIRCGR